MSPSTLSRWRSAAVGPAFIKLEQSGRCLYPVKEIERYELEGPRAASGRIRPK